ncbi:MAG: transcriptional regulator [Oscillospiraceae bacterium]|nr:transcriptional regulator [Oscillospiraceae bacterium]
MARSAHQKEKLLVLLEVLSRESDQEHPVTTARLIQALAARGVSAERKSVYDDLETLRELGYDVVTERGRGHFLASRDFELAELKLLVDAVQSSKFISEGKSRSLIKKLERLCSDHQAGSLHRQVYVTGRVKTMNESVLYSIDAIHEAISANRRLRFRYFDYNAAKEKVFRRDGAVYEVSPVGLLRSDESYYLVALDARSGQRRHYRVDRMASPAVADAERASGCGEIDMGAYARRHFGMFSGRDRQVRLRCPNGLAHVILDRFGMDVMLIPDGPGHFALTVEVTVSQQFYGWLFGLGPEVELTAPADVREEYLAALRAAAERHQ